MADDGRLGQASEGGADRARRVIEHVQDWLFGEPLRELLNLFGRKLPDAEATPALQDLGRDNGQVPSWLLRTAGDSTDQPGAVSADLIHVVRRALAVEQIAAEEFNFRARGSEKYVERAQAAIASFDPATSKHIRALADRLGLLTSKPPRHSRYAETLILGGGYARPLLRARHALSVRTDGVDLGRLSFLGSGRRLIERPPERPVAETYAPGAANEFELMVGAARTVFRLSAATPRFWCGCDSTERVCPAWLRRRGPYDGAVPAEFTHELLADLTDDQGRPAGSASSASTGRPPDRPNTADTLDLWSRTASHYPGQRVLVVTSQYFVPFQGFDCLRLLYLPYAIDADVVGFDDQLADPAAQPGYLLMETLSAIRSARRLLVAAVEILADPGGGERRPWLEHAHTRGGRGDV